MICIFNVPCLRKVKYAYHFWKCANAVDQKLSKLVHACRNYSLPMLAHFLRHSVEQLNDKANTALDVGIKENMKEARNVHWTVLRKRSMNTESFTVPRYSGAESIRLEPLAALTAWSWPSDLTQISVLLLCHVYDTHRYIQGASGMILIIIIISGFGI